MFTGIVRELGRVAAIDDANAGVRLRIAAPQTAGSGVALGDSVAIGGVCLTVVAIDGDELAFDAVPETMTRTALGRLAAGDDVNVEPALRAGEPLGGHVMQGHVDGSDPAELPHDAREHGLTVPAGTGAGVPGT